MPQGALTRLALVLGLATIVACGADSTGTIKSLSGSYSLVAANATPLPATILLDGLTRTVVSGTLLVTDSTYRFSVCVTSVGQVGGACGAGKLAVADSGLVWWSSVGASFVDRHAHVSRALVVSGDSLTFQRGDFTTPTFTFVR